MRSCIAMLVLAGCCQHGQPHCSFGKRSSRDVARQLDHRDAEKRRAAAIMLRTRQGVPKSAVASLANAIVIERDTPTRGEMVLTLGCSGAAVAIPHIESMLRSDDPRARFYGAEALWHWRVARGLQHDVPRPDGWHE